MYVCTYIYEKWTKNAINVFTELFCHYLTSFGNILYHLCHGPGSIVGIATGYGLDGPRIESWGGARFSAPVQTPCGPPSLLYNGYRVFPGGKERPGRNTDPSPPSSTIGHEEVELYLYSPYGLYDLYKASVPVQGCTLPLPFVSQMLPLCKLVTTTHQPFRAKENMHEWHLSVIDWLKYELDSLSYKKLCVWVPHLFGCTFLFNILSF